MKKEVLKNIDVITSGPKPPNPSELLVTTGFDKLIEDLLLVHAYDYIIFDTPPIGLVSDAMILLKTADVGLIVTRANYSKKAYLKNVDKFSKEQIRTVSIMHETFARLTTTAMSAQLRSLAHPALA